MTRLTPQERRLGWFMLACGLIYAGAGLFFWVFPTWTWQISGLAGAALGMPDDGPGALSLWHPLGVSMMLTIATCCLLAGMDPRRHRHFALPVVISKAVSTLGAASLLLAGRADASVAGVITTDLPILLLTAWVYGSAARSVNGSLIRGGPPMA